MNHNEIMELDSKYVMETYARYPVVLSHGNNATLTDADGTEYIDFTSGIGVNSLGTADKGWINAVTDQVGKIAHVSNYYYSPTSTKLAETLVKESGMNRVFFGNSGAEANEGAIKVARKYSCDKYGEGRSTIITLKQSFHGRTITTLAATGQDVFHTHFYPFTEGFKYVPINDIYALKDALTADVCAVMVEPIQGEGGVNMMDIKYAIQVKELCTKNDILLIFDEIQTGCGRTGKMFAYKYFGFEPDVLTLAKGLGGGLPIGAFLCGEKCEHVLGASNHGTTFGSNPVAAAGANEVMARLSSDGFLDEVCKKGEYIVAAVRAMEIPFIKDIRGCGLMIGIQIDGIPKEFTKKAMESGLLLLTAGTDVIRLLPPLTITYDEIDKGLAILKEVLTK